MSFSDRLRELGERDTILTRRPEALVLWTDIRTRLTDVQRLRLIRGWGRLARTGDRSAFQTACERVAREIEQEKTRSPSLPSSGHR